MVTLKSITQCPPNGFQYFQPETGWNNLEHSPQSQWDFKLLCRDVQTMRKANPRFNLPTDLNQIEIEVRQTNALRMLSISGGEYYIQEDSAPAVASLKKVLRPLRKPAGAVGAVSKLITGVNVLLDWLGSGGVPVSKETAERRASVCITCPMNQAGDWFTDTASALIRSQIGAKNDLSLSTIHDDKLNTCKICLCPLPLKIWAPLEAVKAHMKDEVRKELPEYCWIIREG